MSMSAIGAVLGFVLLLFLIVLVVRAVLDWTGVLGAGDSGGVARARRLSHTLTEPVLAPVRRVLKPVRAGSVQIDLAFTVVFLVVLVLRSIVLSF
jgi:YggT family protein